MASVENTTDKTGIGASIDPHAARRAVAGLSESFAAGDFPRAEIHARTLLGLVPADPNLRRILAATEVARGNVDSAIRNLRRSLLVTPEYVDSQFSLANTLLGANEGTSSIRHYDRTLCLVPDHGEALINLGNAWASLERPAHARALFQRAAVSQPTSGLAIGNLGVLALIRDEAKEAKRHFKRAHRVDPKAVEANLNLASALRDLKRFGAAMHYYRQAILIAPGNQMVLAGASETLGRMGAALPSDNLDALRDVVISCLASPLIESNTVNLVSQALMLSDFSSFFPTHPAPYDASRTFDAQDAHDLVSASGNLVVHHLMDSLITDPHLERIITAARRRLLVSRGTDPGVRVSQPDLARALAYQATLNEYLWAVTPDEELLVETLQIELIDAVEKGRDIDKGDIHLLAAYRQLAAIEQLRRWAMSGNGREDPALATDLDMLILDRVREQEIIAEIPDLTPIDDAISALVKAQYEENPYPRWNSLARHEPVDPIEQIQLEISPNNPALSPISGEPRVLIAGCGTGRQPIQAAMTYRGASIQAIDLSLPSLAYAKRKAGQLEIGNIHFARADILGLQYLDDQFEIIECSGVLHHMAHPEAGLKALLSVLSPNGLLKIALYSAAARTNVTRLRQWITEQGFSSTLEGIRAFRENLPASGHPDADATCRSIDYNATSAIRDLLFHAQEHQFTIPNIKRILEENHLEFLGFLFVDPRVKGDYLDRFPTDTRCVDLDNWTMFEAENPLTFVSMYQFWCRRAG
jgi:tetratricopeptide (TPR) repeat protein